jgi:Na+-transporting methylmalonyl-CoA/oxaloacetate decarboxylase beta subunit
MQKDPNFLIIQILNASACSLDSLHDATTSAFEPLNMLIQHNELAIAAYSYLITLCLCQPVMMQTIYFIEKHFWYINLSCQGL